MATPTKATVAKSNSAVEISQPDAQFFLACLQNFGEDKQIDLTKVADALGYTNVASVGNRFRALRKRYAMNHLEAKAGSGAPKGVKPTDNVTDATKQPDGNETEANGADGVDTKEDSESELPTPVKPKAKQAAPRKGAKTTSKPVPATDSPAKSRKRGAKSTAKPLAKSRVKEEDDADVSMEDNGNTSSSGMDIAAA
ncbi:uncharacterized protein BO80DRAFT_443736 [Aspergillus ibericus CBS 121593]|uniref:Myb-like DNA-binding domain-containing protein n=1 Tax=Aspergillus ibericus CBS 121593 TaxID=1448316 RepID=A0A395H3V5_9EURO|nr:hypothetical protein BO80DRAFT_443736 [Aspergillus ibericus CBS 121593]RAL02426.1 hypothetical protein BO80DRAFT_443736 [Aspergillus ibericus CBS 121593]